VGDVRCQTTNNTKTTTKAKFNHNKHTTTTTTTTQATGKFRLKIQSCVGWWDA
jgi:hypothetical protein